MHVFARPFGAEPLRAPDGEGGSLSIDQAVAAIQAAPEPEAEPEPEAVETPEPEDTDGEGGEEAPEPEAEDAEPDAEPEAEAEDTPEPAEPAEPALDPPHFWAAEDKAEFQSLPRALQEKVLAYEKNRDTASAKVIQEASEAKKAAETQRETIAKEIDALAAARAKLETVAPEVAALQAKWPPVIDWSATLNSLTAQHGADDGLKQYLLLKEEHAADQQSIAAAEAAKRDADEKLTKATKERDEAEFKAFVETEFTKLATVEPELTDPKHGAERRQKVTQFLLEMGVPAEQIRGAGAVEYSLAYDAMRFRQAKAGAAQVQAKPKPQPQPAGKTLKPSAPPPVVPTQQRAAQESRSRFYQKPTAENAAAAILALQKG